MTKIQFPLTPPSPPRGEGKGEGWLLEIGDWNLFDIWDLEFGI
jgi:hypothetical protein